MLVAFKRCGPAHSRRCRRWPSRARHRSPRRVPRCMRPCQPSRLWSPPSCVAGKAAAATAAAVSTERPTSYHCAAFRATSNRRRAGKARTVSACGEFKEHRRELVRACYVRQVVTLQLEKTPMGSFLAAWAQQSKPGCGRPRQRMYVLGPVPGARDRQFCGEICPRVSGPSVMLPGCRFEGNSLPRGWL